MRKQTWFFIGIYFVIRIFSYFFSPDTPLYAANPINNVVSALVIFLTSYWFIKNDERAWLLVTGELILGGAGGYFAFLGVALRTWLLGVAVLSFVGRAIVQKRWGQIYSENKIAVYMIGMLTAIAGMAAFNGLYAGHRFVSVFADTIPYGFLLYYFPLRDLMRSDKFRAAAFDMLVAAVISNVIFIIFTFAGFSSGVFVLQDNYYHWYRDVALGKITDLGANFYRLVQNEHLLVSPLLILFADIGIRRKNPNQILNYFLIGALVLILSINLTRAYMLGLVVGLALLLCRKYIKRALALSAAIILGIFIFFTAIHLAASRGQSLGWEVFGLRVGSIAAPATEDSSLSRMLLLPEIWKKITASPVVGAGLGDTVRVWSPVHRAYVVTPHFDWGYLEIWAEMGIAGMVAWILFIAWTAHFLLRHNDGKKIFLATLAALLVINITSPALFHVTGILWLVVLLQKEKAPAITDA